MRVESARRISENIVAEFNVPEGSALRDFASLGSGGASTAERDLHVWLRGAFGSGLQLRFMEIDVANQKGAGTVRMSLPYLSPRDLLAELWRGGPNLFHHCVVGKGRAEAIRLFWEHSSQHEWVKNHPHLQDRAQWPFTIPLWIHGDKTESFQSQKILVLSYMSALVTGCSWSSRYVFAVVPDEFIAPCTLQQLLGKFAAELNSLQAGEPVAGPYRFVYGGSKGDLEFFWQAYALKRYYRCNLLCSRCWASKTSQALLWTDMSETAAWRETTVRTAEFLTNAEHQGEVPALCGVRGWSADTLHFDIMHNLFIGSGRDLAGSALSLLCQANYFSSSPDVDDHLKRFQERCRAWCTRSGIKTGPPKLNRFDVSLPARVAEIGRSSTFPELSVKAAHVKLLLMYLAHEAYYIAIALPGQEFQDMAACLFELGCFIWRCSSGPMWFTPAEAEIIYGHGVAFLRLYRSLAYEACQRSVLQWRLRPKLHYIQHTCVEIRATKMNPFFFTCFLDEDFCGKMKRLARMTHRAAVPSRVLQRYSILLAQRWMNRRRRLTLADREGARKRARTNKRCASAAVVRHGRKVGNWSSRGS